MPTIRGLLSDLNNTMNVAYPPLAALNAARKAMPNITMSGLLGGTVDSAKKAYTAPIRAMRGEFDADSPQAYEEALNLAGLIGSSTLPRLTQPVQHGVASMFIGPKAKTWDKALSKFTAPDGMPRGEIADNAALFKYPEQNMNLSAQDKKEMLSHLAPDNELELGRQLSGFIGSLDDYRSQLKKNNLKKAGDITQGDYSLKNLLSHDDLYAAYPEIGDMRVEFYNRSANSPANSSTASFGDGKFRLSTGMNHDRAKSAILHELQHYIQDKEGFSKGGSPSELLSNDETAKDILNQYSKKGLSMEDRLRLNAEYEARRNLALDNYNKLFGEAEARATQNRMNMGMADRLKNKVDYGLPDSDFIFKF